MPPQREIFRQTASATPAPSAPGSAAVSSIATLTATRSRTARIPCRPCVGSSTSSRPAGDSASIVRTASSTLHAPFASRRSFALGPAAARVAATRPASSPTPTLIFRHSKPSPTARAACSATPARSSAASVALTGTLVAGSSLSSAATGLPARRPARSHSARSIRRERSRQVLDAPAGFDHLCAVHVRRIAPAPGGSSPVPVLRTSTLTPSYGSSGAASP